MTTTTATILEQLGGNKFIAMTGSKNFLAEKNTLRMTLVKNKSKANLLYITLDESDTYTMRFIKFTPGKLNKKNWAYIDDKTEVIYSQDFIYNNELQSVFTAITGMYTSLGTLGE